MSWKILTLCLRFFKCKCSTFITLNPSGRTRLILEKMRKKKERFRFSFGLKTKKKKKKKKKKVPSE